MDTDIPHWLREAYRFASRHSDDPVTWNGAILLPDSGFPVFGTNRLPTGTSRLPERLERPAKYDFIVHAEQDAIFQAAVKGVSTRGATLFCPWAPCTACARAIIQAELSHLVAHKQMHEKTPERWAADIERAVTLLREAGIEYVQWDGVLGNCTHKFNGEFWNP